MFNTALRCLSFSLGLCLFAGCHSPAPTSSTSPATQAATGRSLFDGKTLTGWKATDFAGPGEVTVEKGRINLAQGYMTGINWTNDLPRMNYEIALESMRVSGGDFFCGLTFPVGKNPCSLIVGGWGGNVVGLSSLDGEDAANNETTRYQNFEPNRWYRIRVKVTDTAIQAWIDDEQFVNVLTADRAISIRAEVEPSLPLGISTWNTGAAVRNLHLRRLDGQPW